MLRGNVEVSDHELIGTCIVCGKVIQHKMPVSMAAFRQILKVFISQHKKCTIKKEEESCDDECES